METPFLDKPRNGGPTTMPAEEEEDALVAAVAMEAGDLEADPIAAAAAAAGGGGGRKGSVRIKDEAVVKSVGDAWSIFLMESKKLWAIAVPIGFNVLCLYGLNSSTQIFVGHLGNLELSAVAIGLSVISNFSFGFLVSNPIYSNFFS